MSVAGDLFVDVKAEAVRRLARRREGLGRPSPRSPRQSGGTSRQVKAMFPGSHPDLAGHIYPAEGEKRLGDHPVHPAVADIAVVGVPDSSYGDSVHACAVPRPGAEVTARELMVFLRGQIADFKIATAFHFERTLPRNPGGKILRREVRDRLSCRAT